MSWNYSELERNLSIVRLPLTFESNMRVDNIICGLAF